MPLSDQYGRIPLGEIIIKREARQRSAIETVDLEGSIKRLGVLQPIILDRQHVLLAGERRVEASRRLALADIPFRYADELTETESSIIELEENVRRKDLPWQDLCRAYVKIHRLFKERHPDWTQEASGEALGITQGTLSIYLSVEAEIHEERINSASTVREAHNFLSRKRQRLEDEYLEEFLQGGSPQVLPSDTGMIVRSASEALLNGGPPLSASILARPMIGHAPPEQTILREDFLSFAATYNGPKFNFLHCDFPYGQQTNTSNMMHSQAFKDGRGYQDQKAIFDELLSCLIINFNKLMSVSCHVMFWCPSDFSIISPLHTFLKSQFNDLVFYKCPLIWLKSDNAGISPDTQRGPRHIYETALLASRGGRLAVQTVADAYAAPTDNRLHASAKPEPMLRHFFRMLVDESTSFLDPTCGSGSSCRAAESLGARRVLGLEIQEDLALDARKALREARLKREAEAKMKRDGQAGAVLEGEVVV